MPFVVPQAGGADMRVMPGVNVAEYTAGANPFHAEGAAADLVISLNAVLMNNASLPLDFAFGFSWLTWSFDAAPPAGVYLRIIRGVSLISPPTQDKVFLPAAAGPGQLTMGCLFPAGSYASVGIYAGGAVNKTLTLHGLRHDR